MQYIIDIPEHMKKSYEDMIKHCDYKTFEIPRIVVKSIANGIPLPKGHGRLIDADALMEYCQNDKTKLIDCNDIARFPIVLGREE